MSTAAPFASLDPALFDQAPDPMALFAPDGAWLAANAAFRAAFRGASLARRAPWGRVTPPAFVEGVRVFEAPAPDGRRFEWAERLLPDGARFAVARDVTARAHLAEEAARAKTTLFATLTHELRTPLNGVLGMAGLLAQARLEPNEQAYLQAIRQSGEHLLDLITEILDYARLEAGKTALETLPFSPEEVAQSVIEVLSPKAFAKGLELCLTLAPDAPAQVLGDDGRVRQILFNLVGNAVKFTEAGGVVVHIAARPGGGLRFTVKDTGPGIPEQRLALIFQEFAQADPSIARRYGGTGLGLSIVQRLARAMAGEVRVDSREGAGALFTVDLPLPDAPHAPARALRLRAETAAVISRSPVLRAALSATLTRMGAVVRVGPALDDAADAAITLVDHAVLREIPPPTLASLAAAAQRAGRGLIVLLAPEERAALDGYRAAGLAQYLIKPLRRQSLEAQIERALRRGGAAPEEDDRGADATLSGMRVLLAEDNPVNALLARTALSRSGASVTVVGDGEEVLDALRKDALYDLVFLDLRMPRLDGLSTARRIREMAPAVAALPLIALTANDGAEDRAAALAAGMDDFVSKPITPLALRAVAARYRRRRGEPSPANGPQP